MLKVIPIVLVCICDVATAHGNLASGSASHPGPDQSLPVSEIGHFTDGAKNGPSNLNNDIFGKTNKQQPTVTHRETLVPNYLLFNPAPGFTTGSAEVMRPCT